MDACRSRPGAAVRRCRRAVRRSVSQRAVERRSGTDRSHATPVSPAPRGSGSGRNLPGCHVRTPISRSCSRVRDCWTCPSPSGRYSCGDLSRPAQCDDLGRDPPPHWQPLNAALGSVDCSYVLECVPMCIGWLGGGGLVPDMVLVWLRFVSVCGPLAFAVRRTTSAASHRQRATLISPPLKETLSWDFPMAIMECGKLC